MVLILFHVLNCGSFTLLYSLPPQSYAVTKQLLGHVFIKENEVFFFQKENTHSFFPATVGFNNFLPQSFSINVSICVLVNVT